MIARRSGAGTDENPTTKPTTRRRLAATIMGWDGSGRSSAWPSAEIWCLGHWRMPI